MIFLVDIDIFHEKSFWQVLFSVYWFQYGGNPVSCAIALAVLDVIEEEQLMKHAKETGDYLVQQSFKLKEKHPIVGDVRLVYFLYVNMEKKTSKLYFNNQNTSKVYALIYRFNNAYYIQPFAKTMIINEHLLPLFSTYIPLFLKITPRFLI